MSSNHEDFTYLEIAHPVLGAEKFLNKTRLIGERVLGDDRSTVLTEVSDLSAELSDSELSILTVIETGTPRLKVYNPEDLKLPIYFRRSLPELNHHGRLNAALNRATRIVQNRPATLREGLNKLALKHEIMDAGQIDVILDGIAINNDPTYNHTGAELALTLSAESPNVEFLLDEATLCYKSVLSAVRKAANPEDGGKPFHVPFARLSTDIDADERKYVVGRIKDILPIHVLLGAAKYVVHRAEPPMDVPSKV